MSAPDASEQTIFDAARQMTDSEARAAYLEDACAGRPELRQRMENLLQAGLRADQFLAGDPLELGQALHAGSGQAPPGEGPGTVIDKYKLLEKLGEGGFGVVYMAEQKEPLKRRLALKIIKVGMDTREVVARFEAERQALALMDHPHIAKVFDAGATATGRPYFVMEFVRGTKITDYCDQQNLPTRARLDLFVQVCQAVQHAHQKGIIHRDLKPSNILVADNDGVAVPKIIDFGIAKATQMELTEKTVFTRFHQFIGTPAYISPEQAQITNVDIDTRSDIYSLGVLLYELLTGKTPFDPRELLQSGLDEMRRTICEREPLRPSTRLTQDLARKQPDASGKSKIRNQISKIGQDLDWIVMKCLEKDRARRYDTANALASDIQRHLNSEPIVARPPSRLYEFRKTVRRHKLGFAAAGVVVWALALGLGISTWSLAKERHARQRADTEVEKSQQIARFLEDMLRGIDPSVAQGRDTAWLRAVLNNTAERVARDLTNQPLVEAHLETIIASVYARLGELEKAEAMARHGLALRRKHLGDQNAEVASSILDVAYVLGREGRLAEAEDTAREAVAVGTKALGRKDLFVANALGLLGLVLQDQHKLAEAESMYRESLAIRRDLLGKDDYSVAVALNSLSGVLTFEGKLAEAETASLEAITITRRASGMDDVGLSQVIYNRGNVFYEQGKLTEAERCFREVVCQLDMDLGKEQTDLLTCLGINESDSRSIVNLHANGMKFIFRGSHYLQLLYRVQFVRKCKEDFMRLRYFTKWTLYCSPLELPLSDVAFFQFFDQGSRTHVHVLPLAPQLVLVGTAESGVQIKASSDAELKTDRLTASEAEYFHDAICLSALTALVFKRRSSDVTVSRKRAVEKGISFTKIKNLDSVLSAGTQQFNGPLVLQPVSNDEYVAYLKSFVENQRPRCE
jgi:serine/threonine protein kinase